MPATPNDLTKLLDAVTGRPARQVLDSIARRIRDARTIALFSHVDPDGDALGSLAGLVLGLRSLGKDARAYVAREVPARYRPFFPPEVLRPEADPAALPPVDLRILLDAAEPARAGIFENVLLASDVPRICIDHHPYRSDVAYTDILVVTQAPATGSLVLALLDVLGIPLDASLSVPLWIALATDTGWFRFANTSPWALSDASRLARHGIDVEGLHQRICAELSPAQARVLGAVLSRVCVEWGGRFIWSVLPRAVYAAEGLGTSDLEGMIDSLKQVRGAEVIALVVEVEAERYKVSLRSTAQADVEACARRFGGGGHKKAAGFRFSGTSDRLLGELLGAMGAAAAVP